MNYFSWTQTSPLPPIHVLPNPAKASTAQAGGSGEGTGMLAGRNHYHFGFGGGNYFKTCHLHKINAFCGISWNCSVWVFFSIIKWQNAQKFAVVTLRSVLMNNFEWWTSNSLGHRDDRKILWFVRLKFTSYGKQIWRDEVFKGLYSYLWRTLLRFWFGNAGCE